MEDSLVELKPHTLEKLRREVDLDDPDRRREAIDILRDWIKKQDHFLVKDFSDHHLEFRLLTNGGSIEKSKSAIDRLCTLRTLNPQLFGVYNVKEDFAHVFDNGICYALPKVMKEDIRVFFVKFYEKDHIKTYFVDFLRYVIVMAEYMMYHDYLNKTVIVFDFLDINLNSFVTDMDFMEFKRHSTVLLEGFRVKPQKILLLTESKLASTLLAILKTLLKPKIIQRIQVIRNHEELREIVPREILPKDYGGDEIAFKDLKEKWVNELSSPKMIQMLKQRSKERTDESLRPEGYGVRPQNIFLISDSKLITTLMGILKTILKPKIIQRIQVIRSHEELHVAVPRKMLPKDYEKWMEALSSEDCMSVLRTMDDCRTDEARRTAGQFSEHYAGLAGTFRYLNVD